MFTPTMNFNYAQSVQEEHLRRALHQPSFSSIQARSPYQNGLLDKLADLLITSGHSLKQRYQTA